EGISNSIIEYMALSKPVVANDAGGTREVVVNNETGYLIQKESLEQIAKLINNMLEKAELRCKVGQCGQFMIQHQFALDRMGASFESIYKKTIGKGEELLDNALI